MDARSLLQSGAEALRKGDARGARDLFGEIVAAGKADAMVWLGLALACRGLNDNEAKLAAIDKVLALDPRNVRALILKADHLGAAGDVQSASSFYRAAIRATPPPGQLSPELSAEVRRAQDACERYARRYQEHVLATLRAEGFDRKTSSSRFVQSLDILFGEKQIYFQEPRKFFFPGLPNIQFYERGDFPWLVAVEDATDDIRAELLAVLEEKGAFAPYVGGAEGGPPVDYHGMFDNPDWSAFYLWKNGELAPENAARCPATLRALEGVPAPRIKNFSPTVMFSLLRPGARIPPHNGFLNTRLICHLPLIVPETCGFRVGNDVRSWETGKALMFDDTIEHEAWNESGKVRVVLLFDVWRPELSEEERRLVTAMFDATDTKPPGPDM